MITDFRKYEKLEYKKKKLKLDINFLKNSSKNFKKCLLHFDPDPRVFVFSY